MTSSYEEMGSAFEDLASSGNEPLVSVIVPNYNNGSFLDKSISSLCNQTLASIEIIVVDDGSTDSSLAVLAKMARNDGRIKTIAHQSNSGTHMARVTGVEAASGAFIMFLDPDDWFEPDTCEMAVKSMQGGADIVQFNTRVVDHGAGREAVARINGIMNGLPPGSYKIEDILDWQFIQRKFTHNMCNKIFRAPLIKTAFTELAREYFIGGEDMYEFIITLLHARRFDRVDDQLYVYNYGVGISLESQKNTPYAKIPNHSRYYPLLCEHFEKHGLSGYLPALKDILFNWSLDQWNSINPLDARQFLEEIARNYGEDQVISGFVKAWKNKPERIYPQLTRPFPSVSTSPLSVLALVLPNSATPYGIEYAARLMDEFEKIGIALHILADSNLAARTMTGRPRVTELPPEGDSPQALSERLKLQIYAYRQFNVKMVFGIADSPQTGIWSVLAHRICSLPQIVSLPRICGSPYGKGAQTRQLIHWLLCCDKIMAATREDELFLRIMDVDAEFVFDLYGRITGMQTPGGIPDEEIKANAVAMLRLASEYGRSAPLRLNSGEAFQHVLRKLVPQE